MVIYGVDITGSLFVSGSSNFKGDINVSGSQIVSGSLNVLNSLLLNGQPFVGTQGPQGIQGSIGIQGTTGSNGAQGNQGTTGSQGNQGPTGEQGIQGPTGLQGDTGSQGNQGPTGIQGTNGTVGTQGNQGPTGLQGSTGLQGNQGSTGASAGITSYTNPSDNRVLTSVSSTSINAESNLTFNGSTLTLTGNAVISSVLDVNSFIRNTDSTANSSIIIAAMGTSHYIQSRTANNSADTNLLLNPNGANVGIGTTSPGSRLVVKGVDGTNTNSALNVTNSSDNPLLFVRNDGNIGIGTNAPLAPFHVQSTLTKTSTNYWHYLMFDNTAPAIGVGAGFQFGGLKTATAQEVFAAIDGYKETSSVIPGSNAAGSMRFHTQVADGSGLVERMRITSGGNVGIGTSTIESSANYTSVNINGTSGSEMYFKANNTSVGFLYANSGSFNMGSITNVSFDILTNSTTKMRITSAGNVGIGTTSPTRRLHIVSSDDTRGIMVEQTSTSSYAEVHFKANREYRIGTGGSTSAAEAANNWYVYDSTAALQRFVITSAGNVGIGTTSPVGRLSVRQTVGDGGPTGGITILNDNNELKGSLFAGGSPPRPYGHLLLKDASNNDAVMLRTTGGENFILHGNFGIGTASPTSNLSFDGSAVRTIGMERVTASNTAGNSLTISASSATVGATDKNGGDMILSGGAATGTGSSRVVFRTATPNFSSGTGDRTPSDKVIITGSGTIIQNGVSSTFVTGTCLANQSVNLGFTTVLGGRVRVHAIITPTDGTSIGAQKMSVIANSTGGISEVVISNTTTTTIGSWTFSGSGEFFGVTKNAGSASTACTYLIEVIGNLA